MSGDRVVLAGDAHGSAARLVRATARLADAELGPHALVGGLAVMCRLAAVHRATHVIDNVAETTSPTAVEVITSSIGAPDPSNPNRVIVDGVKVDVIDTGSFRDEDLDDLYRLVLAYDRTGGIGDELTTAPFGLGRLVADALRDRVVEQPQRAVRWLLDGGTEMSTVSADDLRDVLGPLVDRLAD